MRKSDCSHMKLMNEVVLESLSNGTMESEASKYQEASNISLESVNIKKPY